MDVMLWLTLPRYWIQKYVLPEKYDITCITTYSGGKWEQSNVPYTYVEPLLHSSLHSSKIHEMARVLYEDVCKPTNACSLSPVKPQLRGPSPVSTAVVEGQ